MASLVNAEYEIIFLIFIFIFFLNVNFYLLFSIFRPLMIRDGSGRQPRSLAHVSTISGIVS